MRFLRIYTTLLLLSLCSMVSYAYDFEVDGLYYNLVSATEKTCELVGVSNETTSVVIPESVLVKGISLAVTEISVSAFKNNVSIESVDLNHPYLCIIPDSFFEGCKNLKKVIIGSNITKIGSYAFRSCPIKELTIPQNIKEIGFNDLYLDKFVLEDANDTISINSKIRSQEIHYGRPIQKMESCQFTVYSGASFGHGIQTLQYGLLNYSTIETLEIPSNITIIEDGAFDGAEIYNLIFQPSNDSIKIGYSKLYDLNKEVTSRTESNFTVRIYENRYYDYYGLLRKLPLKTLRIGRPLDFSVGNKVTHGAQRNTETRERGSYTYITDGSNYTRYVSNGPFEAQKLDKVEINDDLTEIQSYLFYNTTILAISTPDNCDVIGDCSFANSTIGKMDFKHVSKIGKGAFASSKISECSFPCSPFIVEDNAFASCNELQSIDLSYAEKVGNASFTGCANLKEVVLGEELNELPNALFAYCSSLESIYCKSSVPPTVGDGVFDGINKFSCEIFVPKGCKSAYQNALGWNEFLFIYEYNIISKQPTVDELCVELDIPDDGAKYQWYQYFETNTDSKTVTPISSGTYVWEENAGVWSSSNKGKDSSSAVMSATIDVQAGDKLSFDWNVSSESGYDFFYVTIDGSQVLKKSGTDKGTYEKEFTSSSTVSVEFKYTKNSSQQSGSDCATVSEIRLTNPNGFIEKVDSEIENATASVLDRSLITKECEVYCVVTLPNGRILTSDRVLVKAVIPGDANADGHVTQEDLSTLVAYVLGTDSSDIVIYNSDMNSDGAISIADITALIDNLKSSDGSMSEGDGDGQGGNEGTSEGNGDNQGGNDGIKEDDKDNHEYVDLGLPSGTLWATCNVGADNPEDYGYYFAWGEVEPKITYNWSTYKYCKGSSSTMTKYCTQSSYGTVDNKTELDLEDDAAYMNWGEGWRMPSDAQLTELRNICTWTWDSTKKGYTVLGPNNRSLFLPAAGYYYDSSLFGAGSYGYYWSRSLSTSYSYDACYLNFSSGLVYRSSGNRCYGRSVRPVRQN